MSGRPTDNKNGHSADEVTVPALTGGTPVGLAETTLAENEIPSTGGYRNEKHQYWWNGQGPVPSVTTVLRVLDKPAISTFRAKESARAIYLYDGPPMDEDEAIRFGLNAADRKRDEAAQRGTDVHLLADIAARASESDSKGFQVSDGTFSYIEAYRRFLGRFSASSIVSSEHMVWSLNGYAGTYDLLMRIECREHGGARCLWLVDIKTSGKGPYRDWALQLAAYRWADMVIVPDDPRGFPMPEIQHTGVLHLQPDLYIDTGYRLWEYHTTYSEDYIRFLAALEMYKWIAEGRHKKSQLTSI